MAVPRPHHGDGAEDSFPPKHHFGPGRQGGRRQPGRPEHEGHQRSKGDRNDRPAPVPDRDQEEVATRESEEGPLRAQQGEQAKSDSQRRQPASKGVPGHGPSQAAGPALPVVGRPLQKMGEQGAHGECCRPEHQAGHEHFRRHDSRKCIPQRHAQESVNRSEAHRIGGPEQAAEPGCE